MNTELPVLPINMNAPRNACGVSPHWGATGRFGAAVRSGPGPGEFVHKLPAARSAMAS